eukprot:CAMPEP_0195105712 /NCGR_PEP_ID=MMETSP0448-20130528/77630_1 /TAXON_ID=66468 /ORGANISM="Heterocapsa triquestra, Strain CCMP 448" /LENGTH=49 /DNA_ID= /DNA_START= /DNA_END= /DNA_ORIENTATION=
MRLPGARELKQKASRSRHIYTSERTSQCCLEPVRLFKTGPALNQAGRCY